MATGVKYDSLWKETHRSFDSGALRVDHTPVDGDARWGLSLVLLPPAHVADAVSAAATELGSLYDGTHHIYDAAGLHLTVTSREPYRDKLAQTTIKHYVEAVERARDLLDVNVRLVGLGGSPSGVFVQGFDDETLAPIRRQMREAAADLHDGARRRWRSSETPHTSPSASIGKQSLNPGRPSTSNDTGALTSATWRKPQSRSPGIGRQIT